VKNRRGSSLPQPGRDQERYRIEVGRKDGVKPGNIVGAIANEAGLDGKHIGHIEIETDFCLIDLPSGMPHDIFLDLKKVTVCGEPLNISRYDQSTPASKESSAAETPEKKRESKRPTDTKDAKKPRKKGKNKLRADKKTKTKQSTNKKGTSKAPSKRKSSAPLDGPIFRNTK